MNPTRPADDLDPPRGKPRPRLASLDAFRGITVAAMILANNPGSWSHIYPPLRHAEWDGWTPTDLIFPSFLFIVGVSITFALGGRRDDPAARRGMLLKIARRSAVIFGLGIALAKFPFYQDFLGSVRIPGVLQRITLCYLAAALIFAATRARGQAIVALGLLVGYHLLMRYVPVPEFGAGDWRRGHDLASYLDRLLLPHHIYKTDYDPEGLLSTLPAVATTLLGVLAGHRLRSGRPPFEVAADLFAAGAAGAVLGWAWGGWFPINKALWSPSFVLLTGGLASTGLALCYWGIDLLGYRRWSYPFRVLGANAIAAYTLAAVGSRLLNLPYRLGGATDPRAPSLHQMVSTHLLDLGLTPINASLAYAVLFLLACYLVIQLLHGLGVHIRA